MEVLKKRTRKGNICAVRFACYASFCTTKAARYRLSEEEAKFKNEYFLSSNGYIVHRKARVNFFPLVQTTTTQEKTLQQKKMAPTNSTCEIFSSFLKRHRRARMTRPYPKTIIKNDAGIKRSSCESDSDCNDRRSSSSDDADRERPGSDHSSASATTKYLAKPSAFRLGLGVYFNALDRESLARDVHKIEIC
ncbi:unnamed protein product [Trichogramma brassicae]|uniref:Uncharacterized protein n=1 Tax=Trichogramma brassicae TaxID=86971 RepID=A0A6H5J554_9HYME|nr:unnamed protein product [Trichogramma brassicae]